MRKNNPDIHLVVNGGPDQEALLKLIENQLEDDKIEDIKVFKLASPIVSYMVIGTGTSSKHISSSAEKLADKIEEVYQEPQNISMEGRNKNASWILIDLEEIIVHLFTREARELYNLEELYSK